MKLGYRATPAVAHPGSQSAHQLMYQRMDRPLVRNSPFNALGYELGQLKLAALSVAIAAALFHRRERSHPAVSFKGSALEQNDLARALIGSGKQRADHH